VLVGNREIAAERDRYEYVERAGTTGKNDARIFLGFALGLRM